MNILFICDEFPPGKTGGIGTATELLATGLLARGHQVFVAGLCMHGYAASNHEKRADGIEVWRLRYKTDIGLITSKDELWDKVLLHSLRFSGFLGRDARKMFQELVLLVKDLIKEKNIDVIEMPDWNNFFFNLRPNDFQLPSFTAPLIVKMHGSYNYFRTLAALPEKKQFRQLEDRLYERADQLTAVSAFTAREGQRIYSLHKPIKILYNGIKVGNYCNQAMRSNSNQVLFSGSLLPKKGIYQLVKAWPEVVARFPSATLHIYGKGDQNKILKLLTKAHGSSVFLYGHISRENLLLKLQTADLAVFPSFSETFGMAAAEAMAIGCPTVFTTRSSGPELITDQVEGWLTDPSNTREIANTICEALSSAEKREAFAKAAYQKVKDKFSLDAVAQQHECFYQEVIRDFKERTS